MSYSLRPRKNYLLGDGGNLLGDGGDLLDGGGDLLGDGGDLLGDGDDLLGYGDDLLGYGGKIGGKKCDLLACAFKNTLLLMLVLFDIVYIILLLKLEMKENWQVRGPLQPCAPGDILKSIFEHFKRSLFGFCHF